MICYWTCIRRSALDSNSAWLASCSSSSTCRGPFRPLSLWLYSFQAFFCRRPTSCQIGQFCKSLSVRQQKAPSMDHFQACVWSLILASALHLYIGFDFCRFSKVDFLVSREVSRHPYPHDPTKAQAFDSSVMKLVRGHHQMVSWSDYCSPVTTAAAMLGLVISDFPVPFIYLFPA